MTDKDYYAILGVDRQAGAQEIKNAYRRLAFQFHPDRNRKDPEAAARMKEVNEAYAVLSDQAKRREYDRLRQTFGASAYGQFRQAYTEQDIFRGSDINQIFEEFSRAFGLRGFEEVFKDFYGPGFRSFEFRRPGVFGRAFVFTAGRQPGAGAGPDRLPSGLLGKAIRYALKKRWGMEWPERGTDRHDRIRIRPAVARQGGSIRYVYRPEGKELIVHIPPGIRNGQKIRLRGMGVPGRGGGEPGDLYVQVDVRESMLQRALQWLRSLFG